MPTANFSVNKISLWAELEGVTIDLTEVRTTFAMNSIPEATLTCAIGREVTSLEAAAIHTLVNELDINIPITVFAQATEIANSGISGYAPDGWPAGEFVVFDGKVVGVGFDKSRSGVASLVLAVRHWLMDLEYAVTNVRNTHPINAVNFKTPAGIEVGDGSPSFLINTFAKQYFTTKNVQTDMWAESIEPLLQAIIALPVVFQGEDIAVFQGAGDASVALNMFEPFNGGYTYGVPLAIDSTFQVIGLIPAIMAICDEAATITSQSFFGSTIWEKILDFSRRFLFSVVPMAERALIVPVIPGLLDTWVTIDPSEYDRESLQVHLSRGLSTMVIFTGINSMTGALGFVRGQAGAVDRVGGIYDNENFNEGMIAFRDGPQWLTNSANPRAWGFFAAAPGEQKGDQRIPNNGQPPGIPDPKIVRDQAIELWDEYARALYLTEVFRERVGSIIGKIRFDIAPGSSVELVLNEEPFVAQQTGVTDQSLFGIVTCVETIINSEAVQGQTRIEFGFLRNEAENADPGVTTSDHPLYENVWVGAPEVEGFEAEPPPE